MIRVRLHIQAAELVGIEYLPGKDLPVLRSVRGKTAGAYKGAGSFQWTSAVRALLTLFLKAVEDPNGIHLSGYGGSLAVSWDDALSKQPVWLCEMFGADAIGHCVARRFISRTNPERKRPGPVSLSLNQNYLAASMIEVVMNGKVVTDVAEISAVRASVEGSSVEVIAPATALAA